MILLNFCFLCIYIDDWTILDGSGKKYVAPHAQNLPAFAAAYGYNALFDPVESAEEVVVDASYVNLLENPEKFTGYSGPSAQRVWKSIQEENCFGEQNDVCLEKRVFYRYIYILLFYTLCVLTYSFLRMLCFRLAG
jgi:hypothetical protein